METQIKSIANSDLNKQRNLILGYYILAITVFMLTYSTVVASIYL